MASPGRPKGGQKHGGRQKGTPNKFTKTLRDMILGALDDAGGQAYLAEQAQNNPGAFLSLIGRVLPTTIAGDANAPLVAEVRRVIVDPAKADNAEP